MYVCMYVCMYVALAVSILCAVSAEAEEAYKLWGGGGGGGAVLNPKVDHRLNQIRLMHTS